MTNAFIVGSKRTAFGSFGGKLSQINAAQLGGHAAKAALAQAKADTPISSTVFGVVTQSDSTTPYLSRHVGHHAGLPITVPALTINRLCGSGFQAAINAFQEIKSGDSEVVLTGGTENMSMSPYTLHGVRFGNTRYGVDLKLVDSLASSLVDQVPVPTPMGVTAENLAVKYGITREQCDQFALQSQQLSDLIAVISANGRAEALMEAERATAAEQGRIQRERFLTPGSGYQPGNAQMFN